MSSTDSNREGIGINALSIDGGSIASLISSLELVDELMRRIQREMDLPNPPLPRKYFRLMVGAGFAGLLVIMLGRLGMSVQEARGYCVAIMDETFSERKRFGGEAFKRAKLVAAVEKMLESCGAGADARMADLRVDSSEVCKVMVCVAPRSGIRAGMAACMRTYATGVNRLPDCTIVEAVCSTFAAPRLFKPMDVLEPGGITSTYIGLSSFNPMAQLLGELAVVFQGGHISCVLSIGAKQKEPTTGVTIALIRRMRMHVPGFPLVRDPGAWGSRMRLAPLAAHPMLVQEIAAIAPTPPTVPAPSTASDADNDTEAAE
ncbi:hypothetical protein FRC09_008073 [Ceratobasidium sp. 395]|nr:hypothetical protein FRC09_008073 [Ceratobasidium sp. 395]